MSNILVTGGAGFIGANFVRYWLSEYAQDRVIVLDALTYAGNRNNLTGCEENKNYRFVHGDILDNELTHDLLTSEHIDTIVHFAAESHVDRSISAPDAFIQTNVLGTHSLLKTAKDVWLNGARKEDHRFHHISTDEVFGSLDADDAPFQEDTPYAPNSPYAASKAGSDHLVRAYHHTYGLKVTTSNCSNNYGPYQFPEKLIPLMIVHALTGQPLPVYGDGSNIRDWLYVEDHCRGIDLVLKKGRIGETYNIGGRNEQSNMILVREICGRLDREFSQKPQLAHRFPDCPAAKGKPSEDLITQVTDRPGHDWRYAINASKASAELGYKPRENFTSGLDKTISWMLDNEAWWRAVLDGSYRNS